MPINTLPDVREVVVSGARSVFTHSITEDADIEKLLRLLLSEVMARNGVNVIICVGRNNRVPEVAITDL